MTNRVECYKPRTFIFSRCQFIEFIFHIPDVIYNISIYPETEFLILYIKFMQLQFSKMTYIVFTRKRPEKENKIKKQVDNK